MLRSRLTCLTTMVIQRSLPHPIGTVFYVPTQASRPGNYVIKWTGNGTIALSMNNTQVSGSLIGSGGGGRYEFSTTDFRFDVRIAALPVTNLMVYHIADETALVTNGEVFGVKFSAAVGRSMVWRVAVHELAERQHAKPL